MGDQPVQQSLADKVSLFVDNSLSKEDKMQFITEMQNDPAISEMVAQEKYFKDFIKNKVPRRKVSPNMIEGIMRNIDSNS